MTWARQVFAAVSALIALLSTACAVPLRTAPQTPAQPTSIARPAGPALEAAPRLGRSTWTTPSGGAGRTVADAPSTQWDLTRPGAAPVGAPDAKGFLGLDIPVRASISYLHEDTASAGIYVQAFKGLTVGAVVQSAVDGAEATVTTVMDPVFTNTEYDTRRTRTSLGPLVQVQVIAEGETQPYVGIGGYALLWGDDKSEEVYSVYAVASKGVSAPAVRALRFDAGFGYMWRKAWRPVGVAIDDGGNSSVMSGYVDENRWQGWVGVNVEVFKDVSVFAQLASVPRCEASFTVGLRWSTPLGIDVSLGLYECLEPERDDLLIALPAAPGTDVPFFPSGNPGGGGGGAGYAPGASSAPATLGHLWGD